jgi:hypothetical protein
MREWIQLKAGPQLKGNAELEQNLEAITKILFAAIGNSNFDVQISEAFQDLGIGTGCILAFKGDAAMPFRFVNVPLSQIYLEEGPYGRTETAFRRWRIPVRNIEETWPNAKLSTEMKEKLKDNPDDLITIIEGTFPDKVNITRPDGSKIKEGYRYMVVEEGTKHLLTEREMKTSPWIVFRWSTLPGEIYGRGPVLVALPDIKTLNKTKELLLKSGSMAIFGMYTAVDDGTINLENIKFSPGAIIPVSQNEGSIQGPTLAPLRPSGDPNLGQIIIQDLKNTINNMMFADPLGPIDLPVKSATEISIRQQELAKRIGSAFGRLQFELIAPLINRLLDILDELGLIALGDFVVDGSVIAIEHVSPLAQAQGEEEVMSIMRYMEMIVGMYGPESLQAAVPLDRFVPEVAPRLNVPQAMVPTPEEFEQMKAAMMQMAQAQMQLQQEQQMGRGR